MSTIILNKYTSTDVGDLLYRLKFTNRKKKHLLFTPAEKYVLDEVDKESSAFVYVDTHGKQYTPSSRKLGRLWSGTGVK